MGQDKGLYLNNLCLNFSTRACVISVTVLAVFGCLFQPVKKLFFNEAHMCKPSVIGMGYELCKICLISCIWKVVESTFCLILGDEEDGYHISYSNFNHYL